jgi:hypothetical protein
MQELKLSPQYELVQSLRGFNISIFTFDRNFQDLKSLIIFTTSDPRAQHLYAIRNRDKLNEIMSQIIRLTHNYVASALSLIDHTRRLHRNLYEEDNSFPEYQERVDAEFVGDGLAQFIKGLRQYCQHYKAPNLEVETKWPGTGSDLTRTVYLLKEDLESFDGWNVAAKSFLAEVDTKVDLLNIAEAYRTKVLAFYEWFQHRQLEIHAVELDEFRSKEQELLLLMLDRKIESSSQAFGRDDVPHEPDEIFLAIFSSDEFARLNEYPMESSERAEEAIRILGEHAPVSEDLAERIRRWYTDVGSKISPKQYD